MKYSEKQKKKIKAIYIEALHKSLGIVTTAVEAAGVSRQTIWNWRKEDPDFNGQCEEIDEVVLDFAENALLKNIQSGDTPAIKFFLSSKGRKRGYTENVKVDATVKGDMNVTGRPTVQLVHINEEDAADQDQ